VLGDQPQPRAQQLQPHTLGIGARRAAAHVLEAGALAQLHLPPGVAQPRAQVGVLAVHEESLVEAADLLERLAPYQQRRALQELGGSHAAAAQRTGAPPPRPVQAGDQTRKGEPQGQRHRAERRPDRRALRLALGVEQQRAGGAEPGAALGALDQPFEPVFDRPRVGVEQQHPAPRGCRHPRVGRAAEPVVARLADHTHRLARELRRALGRAVVDHDELVVAATERGQATAKELARVVGDDDDRDGSQADSRPAPMVSRAWQARHDPGRYLIRSFSESGA
jgi:hypothetical protein